MSWKSVYWDLTIINKVISNVLPETIVFQAWDTRVLVCKPFDKEACKVVYAQCNFLAQNLFPTVAQTSGILAEFSSLNGRRNMLRVWESGDE